MSRNTMQPNTYELQFSAENTSSNYSEKFMSLRIQYLVFLADSTSEMKLCPTVPDISNITVYFKFPHLLKCRYNRSCPTGCPEG